MREIRQSGSEGGVALTTPSLPLSWLTAVGEGACDLRATYAMVISLLR